MSAATSSNADSIATHAICPYCALLCDDLDLAPAADGSLRVRANGCPRAELDYARPPLSPTPLLHGRAVALQRAIRAAATALRRAQQPLLAGLATDVDGARAALDLAERTGAILDHVHGETLASVARVLQSRGWYAATLSELRNRADLVLLVGLDLNDRYTNLIRRCLAPAETLDADVRDRRHIVYLGSTPPTTAAVVHDFLRIEQEALPAAAATLLALLRDEKLERAKPAGLALSRWRALVARLRAASYVAVVVAPGLLAEPRDSALYALCDIVDQLNRGTRAAMVMLGGDDGGQSVQSACSWLTGYPLRIAYRPTIDYQPQGFASAALTAHAQTDCLLWIDAFGRHPLPPTFDPARTIVLGATRPAALDSAAVFIPVGTPGVDHVARLVRSDGVVCLRLPAQRTNALPAVATILRQILATL